MYNNNNNNNEDKKWFMANQFQVPKIKHTQDRHIATSNRSFKVFFLVANKM